MPNKTIADKLTELFELLNSGALTKFEFESLKKQLLYENEILSTENIKNNDLQNSEVIEEVIKYEEQISIIDEIKPEIEKIGKSNSHQPQNKNKYRKLLVIGISLVTGCVVAAFIYNNFFVFETKSSGNMKLDSANSDNKIIMTAPSKRIIILQYQLLSNADAKEAADKAIEQIFDKDYYNANGAHPKYCSLSCDTIIISDVNNDKFPDALAHYWGEDAIYGNSSMTGWILIFNQGNDLKIINSSIHYRFEYKKMSNDTVIGIIPQYDGSKCCPSSQSEAKYVFKNNDFILVSEKTIWVDTTFTGDI